ncbi:MAG: carboxypeptidase-like regulatory domain-containing protein [Pontibacter sp.]|nr:carboxypeptidase-like regulatory domain-containing protein [Pontibacter sp.]
MKDVLLLFLSVLFLPILSVGQSNQIMITGRTVDSLTRTPIPFISIGIKGQDVGTVGDENGFFELLVNKEKINDSLVVSSIGYKKQLLLISDLLPETQPNRELLLKAETVNLQEVRVSGKRLKRDVLGNEATPAGVGMTAFKFSSLGNEIGLLCKVNGKMTYLEEFGVDIFLNDYDTLFFRLNVYALEGGLPKENILREPIYLKFSGVKGKASVNLIPYNIAVDEDFVVSLEYIKKLQKVNFARKEQSGLYFGAKKIFGGTVFTRNTSQSKWIVNKSGLFAPRMEVVVKN